MWAIFLLLLYPAAAQTTGEALSAAREAMLAAPYCFLISLDNAGQPQARLMEPFAPDAAFRLYFGTTTSSRKVAQIRANSRVSVAYYDAKGPNYVTLLGTAKLLTTPAAKRPHWKPGFAPHFPGGPDAPTYTVIEFTPSRIELVSVSRGIAAKPGAPSPAILDRRGSDWVLRANSPSQ